MTKARDISKLLSTANGKIAGENLDVSFENITDTGTEGTRVASGTSAQRGTTAGQLRFNTTTGLAEYYTGTAFKSIDAPPTVSSLDVTEVDSQAGGNQTIVITGSSFASGATVTFVGSAGTNFNASTVTVDSDTQITVVAPKASFLNAQEPYGVRVVNSSGLSGTLADQINVDTLPSWSTASGQVGGTIYENIAMTNTTLTATDADNDTIAYSIQSGALPTGITLNSSTGVLSGTPTPTISADTTYIFTARATANSKTVDRAFNIVVKNTNTGLHAGLASGDMTGGTNWFNSTASYYAIEKSNEFKFQAGDLITQFQTRKSGTGNQVYWQIVWEETTTANRYVIICAWRFSYSNSDGAVMTHTTSSANNVVTHSGLSTLSNNRFLIPSGATATNGTGNYYLGWNSWDGAGSGALYVDDSTGSLGTETVSYISYANTQTQLGLSNVFPNDISSGTEITMDNLNQAYRMHMNASGTV